jgi:hypothetical protein
MSTPHVGLHSWAVRWQIMSKLQAMLAGPAQSSAKSTAVLRRRLKLAAIGRGCINRTRVTMQVPYSKLFSPTGGWFTEVCQLLQTWSCLDGEGS